MALVVVQEEVETGLVLGTAGEEEEVVVGVEAEEVEVVERGLAAGNPQDLHLETGGPVVDWESAPSVPASVHWSRLADSWGLVQGAVEGEEEGEEKLLRWSVQQVGDLAVEG